ncbi:MAG: EcsC family protein [Caulobacteraceae bacterium]|nr:EcsC family protein [Caulobacteraceae bacterium]
MARFSSTPAPRLAPAAAEGSVLTPNDLETLRLAVERLERPTLAARVADYAGQPVNAATKYLPKAVGHRLRSAVRKAIYQCLEVAIASLEPDETGPPLNWTPKLLTGLTGGIGGVFGLVGLPFELPLTTTLMLRAIADIARAEGEDLASLETRLACLEMFALGGRSPSDQMDVDYYAVRAVLTKLTGEVSAYVMERGAMNASSPIIARLVGEIAGRFGLALSERVVAGAVPIIGAVGGASVNMIFMDHFQRVASGHFAVRRLERAYGVTAVRGLYEALAAKSRAPGHGPPRPRRALHRFGLRAQSQA